MNWNTPKSSEVPLVFLSCRVSRGDPPHVLKEAAAKTHLEVQDFGINACERQREGTGLVRESPQPMMGDLLLVPDKGRSIEVQL